MNNRLEIFKNNTWLELVLKDNKAVRYNVVINKIGSMSKREVSHSNTFELPYVFQNIQALGINIFNKSDLAKAFNARYSARYYVKDKLTQRGFLIINNTNNGVINVNLIDEALEIIDSWGSITYYDLLNSTTINIPSDFKQTIERMQKYALPTHTTLPPLPDTGGRGYGIAKFPNSLNPIGDKFQINKDNLRPPDSFNPYQSRPIFNVMALFDIAIESFGYTPIYDKSIDWERLKLTYMIDKDLSQSKKSENDAVLVQYPQIFSNIPALYSIQLIFYVFQTLFVYPQQVNALTPLFAQWYLPDHFNSPWKQRKGYFTIDRCILKPNVETSFSGYMQWKFFALAEQLTEVRAIWRTVPDPSNPNSSSWIETVLPIDEDNSDDKGNFDYKVNKSNLIVPPQGSLGLVGVYLLSTVVPLGSVNSSNWESFQGMYNLSYTETSLPAGIVSYDKFDQYEAREINLTHAAPRETLKDLMSAVMQREGILMSFQNRQKKVKLFSYSSYVTRKEEGNFRDWSKYFLTETLPIFNTDFGNEYAKKNEIGLASPFRDNTTILTLNNQGLDSKYKDFAQNLSSKFKDIEGVNFVQNPTTPYFEYTNKGLGLVEISKTPLGTLKQVRADGSFQGNFSGLTAVQNVNGAILPSGLSDWYSIIDECVKCEATFLLPTIEVLEVDMSEPIYVEGLGGFYIIEEIQEYIDAQTPVKIKLIKMIIPALETAIPPNIDRSKYDHDFYTDFYE